MTPQEHTDEVLKDLATRTDKVILFYSCGKDSIALLHLLRKYFSTENLTCVYMAFLEGLEHNRYLLDWVSPNRLIEVTHWITSQYLAGSFMRFHKPLEVQKLKLSDIEAYARRKVGTEWIVDGIKQNDSMNRRIMLRQFENQAIDAKHFRAHPLSKWKQSEVLSYIRYHRLPRPFTYEGGSASQGIDLTRQCLTYLRDHHPGDYKKILEVFPLAETVTL